MKLIPEKEMIPQIYGGKMPSPATLSRLMRKPGGWPPYVRLGRVRFYDILVVEEFIRAKMQNTGK